jgi:hypothetical protein
LRFRVLFAYTGSAMAFGFPFPTRKVFVVTCKRCRREVPAGITAFPFQSIVVACPLCAELRRYLPSEVFLGIPHALARKQASLRIPAQVPGLQLLGDSWRQDQTPRGHEGHSDVQAASPGTDLQIVRVQLG